MRAGDIAEPYPVVELTESALVAAQLLARDRLPGLVVLGTDGRPAAVLPAVSVIRAMVPDYIQRDPSLARVIGEKGAEKIVDRLRHATVADLLPEHPQEVAVLGVKDTVLEIAAVMARLRSPLCAIVDGHRVVGVVTASHLVELVCGPRP